MITRRGISLVELLIAIGIMVILAVGIVSYYGRYQHNSRYVRTKNELRQINAALEHWISDNDSYPADVSRGLPSGLEDYLPDSDWPNGPWNNSVYDWDNWLINNLPVYQISLRFCGQAESEAACEGKIPPIFPTFDKYSAVYYCVEGNCQAHNSKPADHPGLCINCNQNENLVLWGGN